VRSHWHFSLLTALPALIALLWAQVGGLPRGYWCWCESAGLPLLTETDHCHHDDSPDSPASHHHDHDADLHHDHSHHGPDGPVHDHSAAVDRLLAQRSSAAFSPPPAPLPVLALIEWHVIRPSADFLTVRALSRHPPPPPDDRFGPASAASLSRTVAQLI
jgi:hypothetical protein